MSTMTSPSHFGSASAQPKAAPDAASRRCVEADPGPWLVITGPFMIVLTLAAVAWLSRLSF